MLLLYHSDRLRVSISSINLSERSILINQEVQRVSNAAIEQVSQKLIKIFPKTYSTAITRLILKEPKTNGSIRKVYFTKPVFEEIEKRLAKIQENKNFFGKEYNDYDLLFCTADGKPLEPKSLNTRFKNLQVKLNIDDCIDFYGLRKSGQMHKVRLTNNDYQLVAENGGHSPAVMMEHYNEVLETEKRALATLMENDLYPRINAQEKTTESGAAAKMLIRKIQNDPDFAERVMQEWLLQAEEVS